ncbi:predicted protein [Lichtheimia corymbifera JMRC:FSU:9682]|uniref:Uncharacterized protein n=1 Tax=Lichtheimia corymbifera JMRC:FSU:9682 TaxID=1263082 RepID=A0A068RLK1_9FUNG|nr:predicted protein [Lichtheimia corymbifera JMRC:FSU:9682]
MLGATESKIGFKMWTHLASCFGLTTSMDSILATQQKALYVYGEICDFGHHLSLGSTPSLYLLATRLLHMI